LSSPLATVDTLTAELDAARASEMKRADTSAVAPAIDARRIPDTSVLLSPST
jgi:hypothetical protein